MNVREFFDRLYALNRSGSPNEVIAFSDQYADEVAPQFSEEDHERLNGILEGAFMTLDLEEAAKRSSEPIKTMP